MMGRTPGQAVCRPVPCYSTAALVTELQSVSTPVPQKLAGGVSISLTPPKAVRVKQYQSHGKASALIHISYKVASQPGYEMTRLTGVTALPPGLPLIPRCRGLQSPDKSRWATAEMLIKCSMTKSKCEASTGVGPSTHGLVLRT